jgi:hypothetical protein
MRHLVILFTLFLLAARPALAVELGTLVSCATSVFNEIHRTHAWSGKAPADCPARVMVDKYTDGAVVTVWSWSGPPGAAVRTTYSVLMRYPELADAKALVTANRDVKARGRRLERCLNSLITVNDPLDCRYKATKEYSVGETTGTERRWLIWPDDEGRQSLVEYLISDTVATPDPPVDLYSGEQLPPGTDLHLLLR